MSARVFVSALVLALAASAPTPATAQANGTGVREVSASGRSLITLQTRLRYTTMILLPDEEVILDVICGDKDFWIISATLNIAHVKPAKEGAATNLNLVTKSGAVYSFLLTEKNGPGMPDLKVYVNADPDAPRGKAKYDSAADVDTLRVEIEEARAAAETTRRQSTEALAAYQQDTRPGCSSCTARRNTPDRSSCGRSGTTGSSRSSRRMRRNSRRSTR